MLTQTRPAVPLILLSPAHWAYVNLSREEVGEISTHALGLPSAAFSHRARRGILEVLETAHDPWDDSGDDCGAERPGNSFCGPLTWEHIHLLTFLRLKQVVIRALASSPELINWGLVPRAILGLLALLCGNGYIVGINQVTPKR